MIKFYTRLNEVDNVREVSSLIGQSDEYEGKGIGTIINTEYPKGVAVCFDENNTPCGFAVLNMEEGKELIVETVFAAEQKEKTLKELFTYIKEFAIAGKKDKISVYPYKEDEKLIELYQKSGFKFASYREGDYLFMTKFVDKKYSRIAEVISYLEKQAKGTNVMTYARNERKRRENAFIKKAEKALGFNVSQYLETPQFIASAMFYEEMNANKIKMIELKKAVVFKNTQPQYWEKMKDACPVSFKHFEKWAEDCVKVFDAKELNQNDLIAKAERNRAACAKNCTGTQIPLDID